MCLNHSKTTPHCSCLWKNCLLWNQSLVPKRLGSAPLEEQSKCFQSGHTILYFHQQCRSTPIFPQFHPHLLILAVLGGRKCYFTVVFICISLMVTDVEHLFVLLIICICLKKCLFWHFAHFLAGILLLSYVLRVV